MSIPTQVSAVKGVRKSKKPVSSEMSFLSRMLIPVCMNGLVIPTTFSLAAVRVSGATARSASCRECKIPQTWEIHYILYKKKVVQSCLTGHLNSPKVSFQVLTPLITSPIIPFQFPLSSCLPYELSFTRCTLYLKPTFLATSDSRSMQKPSSCVPLDIVYGSC